MTEAERQTIRDECERNRKEGKLPEKVPVLLESFTGTTDVFDYRCDAVSTQIKRHIQSDRYKNFGSLERPEVSPKQCISRGQPILADTPFCLNELSNQERKFIVDTCNQFRLRNTDKILLTMSTFTGDNVQYAWPCNV